MGEHDAGNQNQKRKWLVVLKLFMLLLLVGLLVGSVVFLFFGVEEDSTLVMNAEQGKGATVQRKGATMSQEGGDEKSVSGKASAEIGVSAELESSQSGEGGGGDDDDPETESRYLLDTSTTAGTYSSRTDGRIEGSKVSASVSGSVSIAEEDNVGIVAIVIVIVLLVIIVGALAYLLCLQKNKKPEPKKKTTDDMRKDMEAWIKTLNTLKSTVEGLEAERCKVLRFRTGKLTEQLENLITAIARSKDAP